MTTKTMLIHTQWEGEHDVEVPADFDWDGHDLGALLAAMHQVDPRADITTATVELTDWESG